MKTIGITGGKGGTGKSTIATSLAYELAKNNRVLLVDADVDCPNDHLLLSIERELKSRVEQRIPKWDLEKCTKCGLCGHVCKTNAIAAIKGKTQIFIQSQCNGCGACAIECPADAIAWDKKEIGKVFTGKNYGIDLLSGELNVNEPISEFIVNALNKVVAERKEKYDYVIIDTAAGTHCPVIAALEDCELALAVTEPTPLGNHDLELILELLKRMKIPSNIILNRSDIGDRDTVEALAKGQGTGIIAEVPYSKELVEQYSSGRPIEHEAISRLAEEGLEMRTVAVLSGKGGVGKSSVTASLAVSLSKEKRIICADCDVDAPNLALSFGRREADFEEWKPMSTNQKPVFDLEKCNSCRKCLDACYFNAIEWKDNQPGLKEFSCEGCGVCELVCPQGAVRLEDVENAKIGFADTGYGFRVVSAQLNMGESGSGKIVAEVKRKARAMAGDAEVMLVDSSAGIGCPVIASVTGSDHALLVTEPTPSGFSDLKRALGIVDHFRIPSSILINKHDINQHYTEKIEAFAKEHGTEVIARIPYDRCFVDALVALRPVVVNSEKFQGLFRELAKNLDRKI